VKNKTDHGGVKAHVIKQLQILIKLAKIDGHYVQEEKTLIRKFSERYNIDPSVLRAFERNSEVVYESVSDFSMDEKVELLYNTVALVTVDKHIMPSEIIYCQEIASKLGFRRSAVQAMLPLVNGQSLELVNYKMIKRKISPYL
jgi:uncharacterized tellurite resistance protein B-like protein